MGKILRRVAFGINVEWVASGFIQRSPFVQFVCSLAAVGNILVSFCDSKGTSFFIE
ncbi:MAG: hypothetical protein ACK41Q_14110 [Candidatus Brocadia sp.]